ncbi:hypothetical protein [Streptomyces sp. NBC_01483]|uniref:hypothetical protein n=1 Tax=Streptomyces sp. NBC_01483 TaxID=2903883 RepID=UPI002E3775AA|nr:hypothetical protein [Streptomyces sp. NBC_01483]
MNSKYLARHLSKAGQHSPELPVAKPAIPGIIDSPPPLPARPSEGNVETSPSLLREKPMAKVTAAVHAAA